jgi:transcriptional regulator with XRE-family HTH domain
MCDFCDFLFGPLFGLIGPVPRKHPLPTREIEIGRRLREIRTLDKCPRSYLAHCLGIDRSVITRIENGRAPLKFGLAAQILPFLHASPLWLATGQGDRRPFLYLPPPEELGVSEKSLFSEVFDVHLVHHLAPKYASPILNEVVAWINPDRSGYRDSVTILLAEILSEFLDELPDESLDDFVNNLPKLLRDFLKTFPKDQWGVIVQRRRHRIAVKKRRVKWEAEARLEQVARLEAAEAKKKSKLNVDTLLAPAIMGGVNSETGYWKALVKRVCALTSALGEKAQLAREMNTTRQAVNKWLSGKGAPSAEITLRLLRWVGQREQKQNTPGSADNAAKGKTQVRKSSYEKQT